MKDAEHSNKYKANRPENGGATKNATHNTGKAVSESFAPGVGGKAYDKFSRTKLGEQMENRAASHATRNSLPKKEPNPLNKSENGSRDFDSSETNKNSPSDKSRNQRGKNSDIASNGNLQEGEEVSDTDFNLLDKIGVFFKKHAIFIYSFIGSNLLFIVAIFAIIMAILAPVIMIYNIFKSDGQIKTTNKGIATKEEIKAHCMVEFYLNDESLNTEVGKTTLSYCEELYEVSNDYKDKYDLRINTTLITATLFYGRTLGEYTNNSDCSNPSSDTCSPGADITDKSVANSWFADADFNKKAKNHVKTLAKYMVITTETNNSCSSDTSKIGRTTTPETDKELADNTDWFTSGVGGSKRKIDNIIAYEKDPTEPGSCPYEDDAIKYINQYKKSADYSRLSSNYFMYSKCFDVNEIDVLGCQKAEAAYKAEKDGLYDKWKKKGIIDEPFPGNKLQTTSFDSAMCPYTTRVSTGSNAYKYGGSCQELPNSSKVYSISDREEGVYYYKLMANFKGFLGIPSEDSFISKYYDYIVKDDEGKILEENELKTVQGIYTLYKTVTRRSGQSDSAAGDYVLWSQKDERWGGIYIATRNINDIGCAAVSLAILVARSGAETIISGEFNPGTFVETMKANGGFSGDSINWGNVSKVAPNFHYVDRGHNLSVEQLADYLSQGYYVAVKVTEDPFPHWVAIDSVVDGVPYMNDPGLPPDKKTDPPEELFSGNNYKIPYGMHQFVLFEKRD